MQICAAFKRSLASTPVKAATKTSTIPGEEVPFWANLKCIIEALEVFPIVTVTTQKTKLKTIEGKLTIREGFRVRTFLLELIEAVEVLQKVSDGM